MVAEGPRQRPFCFVECVTGRRLSGRNRMLKALLSVGLLAGFVGTALAAPTVVSQGAVSGVSALAQPIYCFGYRRDYRNFNQCWHLNARRSRGAARYCSRICE